MTTAIHHVSCCTSRVCLGVCLGVLVCTTHFHNCICCGKRGTYSHFRLWFINPSDSSQCTHSFISPLTFFFRAKERLPSLFFLSVKALPPLHLWRKVHMILTFMAAHSRIITFSRKCSCTSFNVWFVRFLWKRIMDAERKIHNRSMFSVSLVGSQKMSLSQRELQIKVPTECTNVCPENFKVLAASLCWELIEINAFVDFHWDNNLSKVEIFKHSP